MQKPHTSIAPLNQSAPRHWFSCSSFDSTKEQRTPCRTLRPGHASLFMSTVCFSALSLAGLVVQVDHKRRTHMRGCVRMVRRGYASLFQVHCAFSRSTVCFPGIILAGLLVQVDRKLRTCTRGCVRTAGTSSKSLRTAGTSSEGLRRQASPVWLARSTGRRCQRRALRRGKLQQPGALAGALGARAGLLSGRHTS